MTTHSLTDEQQAVIAALDRHERVKVYALAGTGKTTTLKAIAQAYPKKRMLYLAFNKAIADEARNKFPPNVEVRTVHSLAFSRLGKFYRHRLSRLDYFEIAQALGMPVKSVFERIGHFQNFLNSDCPLDRSAIAARFAIQDCDVFLSKTNLKRSFSTESAASYPVTCLSSYQERRKVSKEIADFIMRLYYAMKTGNLQVDHSFYLKDFQLNFASCGLARAYDAVLLDEGQDVNPVILSIFEQFQARKIMVGDRHQKIYGFRGAINAIEDFAADETLYLTRTFRFHGRDQVNAVNDLLYHLKCENNLLRPMRTDLAGKSWTSCTITRSNARLIEMLLGNPGLKTVRHPSQYFEPFFRIFDQKIRVSDSSLSFPDYLDCLEGMAEKAQDLEISTCVKLIKRYDCNREVFRRLYEKTLRNYQNGGDSYLGTAHSTKGLEFDQVVMADDFRCPRDILEQFLKDQPELSRQFWDPDADCLVIPCDKLRQVFARLFDNLLKEEINLLYVAMTRAKGLIDIPSRYRIAGKYWIDVSKKFRLQTV